MTDEKVRFHPHALQRMTERGATEHEIILTIESGEQFPAKFGRTGFRRNFALQGEWLRPKYTAKQIETFAVEEADGGWLMITVVAKYY